MVLASLPPYFFASFLLHSFPWNPSANSATPSSFSASSWSLSALCFTSAENSHCASAASPATSSTAANTPPSISRSSPASCSASVFLSSSGSSPTSKGDAQLLLLACLLLSFLLSLLPSLLCFFKLELRADKR